MNAKIAYLGMDVHARNCVLGQMDENGNFKGTRSFSTSEVNIMNVLKAVKEKRKYLVLEESSLAYWVAQVAKPYVTEVICCDPKQNALIYKGPHKEDPIDTEKLCYLLRLGALKRVYQPETDERAIFKNTVQNYLDLRDQQVALKQKIKALYRHWGVTNVDGETIYGAKGRERYLKQVKHMDIRHALLRLYEVMDQTAAMKEKAMEHVKQLGRKYPEIAEFQKIHGIGEVGSHVFNAFIQTPNRFATRSRLWRYCRLGITQATSDNKPLGYKRLDKSGIGELKALTYRAWMSSMKGDNEVKRYYQNSLRRVHDRVHARLNTQRKIIAVLYGLWKKGETYRSELFSGSDDIMALPN